MKKVIAMALVALTSCIAPSTNSSVEPVKTRVENVKINKDFKNAWNVTGLVRNISSSSIKGAVKIKFLNSNGDVVHNSRARLNDGDPISPGKAGNFKYSAPPQQFDGVTDFDVVFYEQ